MFKLVVLSCLVAAVCGSGAFIAPYAAPLAYAAPYYAPYSSNYRGPLSLAPGQPANILAADGRPLDTLDVNLDRSAHLTAKAFAGGLHYLKKRSAQLLPYAAPLAHSPLLPYAATYAAGHYAAAPIAHYSSPYTAYTAASPYFHY